MKCEVVERVRCKITGKALKERLSCGHEITGSIIRQPSDERTCRQCGNEPKPRVGGLRRAIARVRGSTQQGNPYDAAS